MLLKPLVGWEFQLVMSQGLILSLLLEALVLLVLLVLEAQRALLQHSQKPTKQQEMLGDKSAMGRASLTPSYLLQV
jgi:hypothetical protein